MTWKPKYSLTDKMMFTMRQIGEAIGVIKSMGITSKTLATLELQARELSSYASTSIEGNPLPLTDVKRLLRNAPSRVRDTEKEVLNYNKALKKIYAEVKTAKFVLNTATLEKIQGIVVDGLMDNPAEIGHLRKNHVVIRNPSRPEAVVFMPPDFKDVPKLTKELLEFVKANVGLIDPILLAGLFHRQCVIIHPFMDGNGRTTRLFTTAILGAGGLDVFDIFSFENYYNQNISRYFKAVGLTGDYYELKDKIDFTSWLEYFSDGILDELRRVQKTIPAVEPARLEAHHKTLLAFLEKHGSITQREYSRISNRSLASRKLDFQKLLDLGLIEVRGGGRSSYYVLARK